MSTVVLTKTSAVAQLLGGETGSPRHCGGQAIESSKPKSCSGVRAVQLMLSPVLPVISVWYRTSIQEPANALQRAVAIP